MYLQIICSLVILGVGISLIWKYKYEVLIVKGDSMLPTLHDGDFVLIDKNLKQLDTDCIYILTPPDSYIVIKRLVNIANLPNWDGEYELKYWFLGDNKDNSKDSRHYGWVEEDKIEGRVVKTWRRKLGKKRK